MTHVSVDRPGSGPSSFTRTTTSATLRVVPLLGGRRKIETARTATSIGASKVQVGMVGVNVPIPTPLAYYSFGGWKRSVFGDLNQHGPDAIRFYTKTKNVTARWPSGVKEGAEFSMPTM